MEKTTTLMKNRYTLAEHYTGMEDTFVPAMGVTIIYPAEDGVQKMKLGDGQTTLANLPWVGGVGSSGGEGGSSVLETILSIGDTKNSFEIFDGKASAEYSIAAGTNDKSAITAIVGSTLANIISVNNPEAKGSGSIAFGGGTEATTAGAIAMGSLNRVGVTGFYWSDIVFNGDGSAVITLSTSQGSAAWSGSPTLDWEKKTNGIFGFGEYEGDTISIVNDSKYPACAKIIDIDKTNHKITVDKLPFTEVKKPSSIMPDDYTIFACYQKTIALTHKRWYPRSGIVQIGWAGVTYGIENLASGSASFSAGWNNWSAGDFGATFGRDNISGYACLTTGMSNKNKGLNSIIVGNNIELKSNCINSAGFGKDHILEHDAVFAAGSTHTIKSYAGTALGSSNLVNGYASTAIGLALETNKQSQLVVGQFNNASTMNANGTAQFVVGIGSSRDATANGLILYRDGRLEIGADPVNSKDVVTLDYFNVNKRDENLANTLIPVYTSNTKETTGYNSVIIGEVTGHNVTREYNLSVGQRNTIEGPRNLVSGSDNIVASGRHYTFTAGQSNTINQSYATAIGRSNVIQTAGTFAIGLHNKTYNKTGQFVVGRGNKVESEAMFIVGNSSVITGGTTIYDEAVVDAARSNAFVVWADGRATVGKAPTADMDVATKQYVDSHSGGVSIDDFDSDQFTESNGIISLNLNYLLEQEW